MKRHISYLKYIVRHKWFVLIAGRKVKCSWRQIFAHDLSKFRFSEWFPYADYYYGDYKPFHEFTPYEKTHYYSYVEKWCLESVEERFNVAWLHHQHKNKHHWQYWILKEDSGDEQLIDMPEAYVREMVADWAGARRAISGEWDIASWYLNNACNIKISRETRRRVENILADVFGMTVSTYAEIKEL